MGFIFFTAFNTFESLNGANERLCQSIEEAVFEYRHHLNEQHSRDDFLPEIVCNLKALFRDCNNLGSYLWQMQVLKRAWMHSTASQHIGKGDQKLARKGGYGNCRP